MVLMYSLDLEAMIVHEIESVLGPLKYTSFFKVTSLKLMKNHGPINGKILGIKAKKFFCGSMIVHQFSMHCYTSVESRTHK